MPFLSSEIMADVLANRPAAANGSGGGQIFFATDTKQTFRNTGAGSWVDVSDAGVVSSVAGKTGAVTLAESDLTLTDITTNNVSITKHGLAPKAPNDASKYLDGTGNYSVPAGTASGTVTSVGLSVPGVLYTVSGSPITTSGTLAFSLKTQAANTFLAGPTGGAAATPTVRTIAPADLPVFVGSGASHAPGAVPDPGATAGTSRYLREDGTWATPTGGSSALTTKGDILGYDTAANRIPVGTDGQVLTADSTQPLGVKWSAPSSGSSGPTFSSSSAVATLSGVSYGPIFPMTAPPSASSLIWVNQGTATAANQNGGLFMTAPASGSTSFRCLVKSLPAPPYTFTIFMLPNFHPNSFVNVGMCIRDSATGKLVTYTFTNSMQYAVNYYNSPTSYSSGPSSVTGIFGPHVFLRIADDGTNFKFQFSTNPFDFSTTQISLGRTAFLANPDTIGICIDSENSLPLSVLFLHWSGV